MLPIAINAQAAVRTTDARLIKVAASFGAGEWLFFRSIILPSAVPFLLAGLRLAIGRGMIGIVVGEVYGSAGGVGMMISQAGSRFQTDRVFRRRADHRRGGRHPGRSRCAGSSSASRSGGHERHQSVKLEAQDIRLEYRQPRTNSRLMALDGVNLKIMDGEFVSIVGPSGCGKTTFLSVVDGLIPATAGASWSTARP